MECLLGAKQLHAFSHLGFRTALTYSSSNSIGHKTKAGTVRKPPLGRDGVPLQTRSRAPGPRLSPAGSYANLAFKMMLRFNQATTTFRQELQQPELRGRAALWRLAKQTE